MSEITHDTSPLSDQDREPREDADFISGNDTCVDNNASSDGLLKDNATTHMNHSVHKGVSPEASDDDDAFSEYDTSLSYGDTCTKETLPETMEDSEATHTPVMNISEIPPENTDMMDQDKSPDSDRSTDSGVLSEQSLHTDQDTILPQPDGDLSAKLHVEEEEDEEEEELAMSPDGDDLLEEEEAEILISDERCTNKTDGNTCDQNSEHEVCDASVDVNLDEHDAVDKSCTPTKDATSRTGTENVEVDSTASHEPPKDKEDESNNVNNDALKLETDTGVNVSLDERYFECYTDNNALAETMVGTNSENTTMTKETELSGKDDKEDATSSVNAGSSACESLPVLDNDGSGSHTIHDSGEEDITTQSDLSLQDNTMSENIRKHSTENIEFSTSNEHGEQLENTGKPELSESSSSDLDSGSSNASYLKTEDTQFQSSELFIEEGVDTDSGKHVGNDIIADKDRGSEICLQTSTDNDPQTPKTSMNKESLTDNSGDMTTSLFSNSNIPTDMDTDIDSCASLSHVTEEVVAETESTDSEQGSIVHTSLPAPSPTHKPARENTNISEVTSVSGLLDVENADTAVEASTISSECIQTSDVSDGEITEELYIDEESLVGVTASVEETREVQAVGIVVTVIEEAKTVGVKTTNDADIGTDTEDAASDDNEPTPKISAAKTDRRASDTDVQVLESVHTDTDNTEASKIDTEGTAIEKTGRADSETSDGKTTEKDQKQPTQTAYNTEEKSQNPSEEKAEIQQTQIKDEQTTDTAAELSTQPNEPETVDQEEASLQTTGIERALTAEEHTTQTAAAQTTDNGEIEHSTDTVTLKPVNAETTKTADTETAHTADQKTMDTQQTTQKEKDDQEKTAMTDSDPTITTQTCDPETQTSSDTDTAEESTHTDTTDSSDTEKMEICDNKEDIEIANNSAMIEQTSDTEQTGTLYPQTTEVADSIDPVECHIATCSVDPFAILGHDVISGNHDVTHVNADVRSVGADAASRSAMEAELQFLREEVRTQTSSVHRLQQALYDHQVQSNSTILTLRTQLSRTCRRHRHLQRQNQQRLADTLSELMLLEGRLRQEQRQVLQLLHDKDDVIQQQKLALEDLGAQNEKLTAILTQGEEGYYQGQGQGHGYQQGQCFQQGQGYQQGQGHGYQQGQGQGYQQGQSYHPQDGDSQPVRKTSAEVVTVTVEGREQPEVVVLRSKESRHKVHFGYSSLKDTLKRHKSSQELHRPRSMETLLEVRHCNSQEYLSDGVLLPSSPGRKRHDSEKLRKDSKHPEGAKEHPEALKIPDISKSPNNPKSQEHGSKKSDSFKNESSKYHDSSKDSGSSKESSKGLESSKRDSRKKSRQKDRREKCMSLVEQSSRLLGLPEVTSDKQKDRDGFSLSVPLFRSIRAHSPGRPKRDHSPYHATTLSTQNSLNSDEEETHMPSKGDKQYGELAKASSMPLTLTSGSEKSGVEGSSSSVKPRPRSLPGEGLSLCMDPINMDSASGNAVSMNPSPTSHVPPSLGNSESLMSSGTAPVVPAAAAAAVAPPPPPSESSPFQSLKNVFRRRSTKQRNKKRPVSMGQPSSQEFHSALKEHFKKYDLS